MTFIPQTDVALEISRGNISGLAAENKFGRTTNADNGVLTDVWDRANTTDLQAIWTAPTTGSQHNIVSTSANDFSTGLGAKTIKITGLVAWTSDNEVSETVTMNGLTQVLTANSFVIIHRMEVLTSGTTGPNVGDISATAISGGTVTAQINALQGQTQMAIYGVPSSKTAYITSIYGSHNKSGGATGKGDLRFVVNTSPDSQINSFIIKHTTGTLSAGSSHLQHNYNPYKKIIGPAIIKMQIITDTNNLDVSAGFDIILVDN